MENQLYTEHLEVFKVMPDEKVKEPNMPVDAFLQEAENLKHWVQDDREKLETAGLNWDLVEQLNIRATVLRHAQGIWNRELNSRQEAEQLWKEKSPEAYDLRDRILHSFHYAYRKMPSLKDQVQRIQDGGGHADMIQDLVNLSYLGNSNSEPLQAIKFDFTQLEKAVDVAEEMADLLAAVNGDRGSTKESKVIRDKGYSYLKEVVDEIRECGKYVFWRSPDRLKGYVSTYYK